MVSKLEIAFATTFFRLVDALSFISEETNPPCTIQFSSSSKCVCYLKDELKTLRYNLNAYVKCEIGRIRSCDARGDILVATGRMVREGGTAPKPKI
jgi:hypothetical protein